MARFATLGAREACATWRLATRGGESHPPGPYVPLGSGLFVHCEILSQLFCSLWDRKPLQAFLNVRGLLSGTRKSGLSGQDLTKDGPDFGSYAGGWKPDFQEIGQRWSWWQRVPIPGPTTLLGWHVPKKLVGSGPRKIGRISDQKKMVGFPTKKIGRNSDQKVASSRKIGFQHLPTNFLNVPDQFLVFGSRVSLLVSS